MGNRKNSRLAKVFVHCGSWVLEDTADTRILRSKRWNDVGRNQSVDFAAQEQRFSGLVHNRDINTRRRLISGSLRRRGEPFAFFRPHAVVFTEHPPGPKTNRETVFIRADLLSLEIFWPFDCRRRRAK